MSRSIDSGSSSTIPVSESRRTFRGLDAWALQFLKRNAIALGTALVCMVICYWMITEGTGRLLVDEGFDSFYDGQADSLIHGHWDVSPDSVRGEAFVVHGKSFGYFGFTPALPRMLLNRLFPSMYGCWTRLLMLLWIGCVMAVIVALMKELEVPFDPFLLVVSVLGSTLFFLCSHAIVYHEAIMTGAALALWAYLFFYRYLKDPRLWFLAAGCLLSFLSFFSRFTVGAGPLMLASFLCSALLFRSFANAKAQMFLEWLKFPSPAAAGKHAIFLVLCLGITAVTYASVNHAKFGTWLNPAPFEYHIQYDAARLDKIDGSINHLSNIPFDVSAYFGPGRLRFGKHFPWIDLTNQRPGPGSAAKMDQIEGYTSIPAAMPGLALLAILGVGFAMKSYRAALPVMAAAFTAGCLILTNAYVTFRYLHDYYPFLVFSAILGAAAVPSISTRSYRLAVKALIVITGIWSIAACSALTLRWQREIWAVAAPRAAFIRMRDSVDSLLLSEKLEPIRYKIGDELQSFRTGQVLTVVDPPATYRYDGRRWNYVEGVRLHLFRLLVQFPRGQPNRHMSLWFAGHLGASDAVYIVYLTRTRIEFCSDEWGRGGTCGAATEIEPGREYHVRIDADRLNSTLTVTLDDRTVLNTPMEFHLWQEGDVLLGKSLVPSAHGGEFAGKIRRDEVPK